MRGLGDPRRPATFALLVVLAFVVARFLGVAAHEVLGHGVFALLAGGAFYGVYVSPVTGFALVFLPIGAHDALRVLTALAGILVDIALGAVLFAAYRRIHTFTAGLFALVLLQVLLVYSFAYLGLDAVSLAGGDPAQALQFIDAPHLRAAMVLVGLAWTVAIGAILTREAVRLVAPSLGFRRQLAYALLFWLAPLPIAAVPNAVLALFAPIALLTFAVLLVVIVLALFAAGLRLSRAAVPPPDRPAGRLVPLAAAFLLVVPAWAAFGWTGETAEHLLFAEPPLAAERTWANPFLVNALVTLNADGVVTFQFRFKGVPELGSPLERKAFATFEDRADFALWSAHARFLAIVMTNATLWNVTSATIDPARTAWFSGDDYANSRVVELALERPGDDRLFLQRTQVTDANGTRTFLNLTVLNPFGPRAPIPCKVCFLDEVVLAWPANGTGPYSFVEVTWQGGAPELAMFDAPATGQTLARFRAYASADAPLSYSLLLEVV
ncbi:MAG: hypothetical protein HY557_08250 [Euryarchaeota archaeon]|nr:hypothetical protein [Euryarchaeota archaeon]